MRVVLSIAVWQRSLEKTEMRIGHQYKQTFIEVHIEYIGVCVYMTIRFDQVEGQQICLPIWIYEHFEKLYASQVDQIKQTKKNE